MSKQSSKLSPNKEFVAELERVLELAKTGEYQRWAGVLLRDNTGTEVELFSSPGINLMWLSGMMQQFVHKINAGIIR